MPPESDPLAGLTVEVSGNDPGLRLAAALLDELGAEVSAASSERCALRLLGSDSVTVEVPPASAAQDWAASGAMHLTGRAEGAPRVAPGAPASALRGALIALAALTRARGAAVPAAPVWPDVRLLGERAATAGLQRRGPVSAGGAFRTLRAADGWLGASLARADDLDLVPALVERAAPGDPWAAVAEWALEQPAERAAERAQLLGLAFVRVPRPGSYDDAQARARGGSQPRPVLVTPGGPRRRPESGRPLVVDLSALWAGPLCAHLLHLSGARVVKVESADRPDGARSGPKAFYDLLHAGTESVVLDLRTAPGRRTLRELIGQADVVLESSRPRALQQLGVDAEEVVAAGTTWTSITAYGRCGPWSARVGFGDDVAAAAGLVVDDAGVPLPCGDALADPLTGGYAAAAVAAALLSDRAHLLDVSMRDVCVASALHPTPPDTALLHVARAWARPAPAPAPAPGADTARVLAELCAAP